MNAQSRGLKKEAAMEAMVEFLARKPGASLSEIGRVIGRSKSAVGGYAAELMEAGRLRKNGDGWEVV